MILLDTHVLLWLWNDQSKVSQTALHAIRENRIKCFSAISLWEVAMLAQKGRIRLGCSVDEWIFDLCDHSQFRLLPISPQVAIRSGTLEMHGDPADRLIVATAIEYDLTLLTADHRITGRNVVATCGKHSRSRFRPSHDGSGGASEARIGAGSVSE